MTRPGSIFVILTAGLAAACSSSSPADAGTDATPGHDATHDTGHPSDAGQRDAFHDANADVSHDASVSQDAGIGKTCALLLLCDAPCSTAACTNACYAQATGVAQGLFNAFSSCVTAACADSDASSCDQGAATGACASGLEACEQDKTVAPPDPDGGAVVVPTSDAGSLTNCGQYLSCVAACKGDAGSCASTCAEHTTLEAKALASVLDSCLAMACPSTDGGPCAMPGLACNGCIVQVELAEPDTCAAPYIACNADTSNQPDGGTKPKGLVDGGVLSTIVTGLDQAASSIVASGVYLYFTQVITGGPVLRIPLVDGGTMSPLGPPQPTPVGLAVDANNVYVWNTGSFALNSDINNKDGVVTQVPLNGGAAITLFTGMEVLYDAPYLNSVAVDSKSVYWVAGGAGNDGTIMRTAIGSSSPTAIYSNQQIPMAVVSDGTNVYWTDLGTYDSAGVANNDGTVWQGSVSGATPAIKLASNQPSPYAIVVDATSVYWVNTGILGGDNLPALNSGSVMKAPIGGGTLTTIATDQGAPISITIANGTLVWDEYGLSEPGLIMTAPTSGGTPVPLVVGLDDPGAVTTAGHTVYWGNANSSPTNGSISSFTPF